MNYTKLSQAIEDGATVRIHGKSKKHTSFGYQELPRELVFRPYLDNGRKTHCPPAHIKWAVKCFRDDNGPWAVPLAAEIIA